MNGPIRYESIQEPLDDEERELMDPDNWDWENPIEGVPVLNPGIILEIHLTGEELARLEPVAQAEGMTLHAFLKEAAFARIPQDVSR